LLATAKGELAAADPPAFSNDAALVVVMSAKGYPGNAPDRGAVTGLDAKGAKIFHAGTALKGGELVAAGGRVLGVAASGATVAQAQCRRLSRGRPGRLSDRLLPPRHRLARNRARGLSRLMGKGVKLLIGLAIALAAAWIGHGPLGQGAASSDRPNRSPKRRWRAADVPGVDVRLGRDPLSRAAILSGPANDFQRNGIGDLPGITQRVADVPGISLGRAGDNGGRSVPLVAETLGLAALAYLIGIILGRILFRPKRRSFLE